ncbi:short chain dehydrogenase, partial [Pseudomonas sp. MWU12-2312b]
MRLSEARVVLTVASGAIGLAILTALCASEARILAVARHRQPLE